MMAAIRRFLGLSHESETLSHAIEDHKKAVKEARKTTADIELTMARTISRDAAVTLDIVNRALQHRSPTHHDTL